LTLAREQSQLRGGHPFSGKWRQAAFGLDLGAGLGGKLGRKDALFAQLRAGVARTIGVDNSGNVTAFA